MDAIKLIGTSHGGKLTVDVPEELDDKELEIMIISSKEKNKEEEEEEEKIKKNKERIEKFMSLVGSAKYPNFPITKYDVYDQ